MTDEGNKLVLGRRQTIFQLWKMLQNPKLMELDDKQRAIIHNCRLTLDSLNSDEKPVYGVSTGFGHLENKWIPPSKQSQLQVNLIRSHAIGTGEPIQREVTKLAMILLANSLAKGHSGIRLETLDRIIYLIKHDIIPVSYSIGSLGASGDLAPLAHVALALLGEGKVDHEGQIRETNQLLVELRLEPIELQAKEGLALINGTHFITAHGIFALFRGRRIIIHSLIASALSIEALRGTDTPFLAEIAEIRGHPGHVIVSRIMRQLLEGSRIISSHKDPLVDHKTQDAYALRCIPQVMGAIWDGLAYLERVLAIEVNAVTDNPLIFPDQGQIISGGNFHAEPLGFPLETTIMAMIELGNITEARIARLVSPFTPELPAFLASSPGLESGYMIAHYTAAAMLNKLRGMAHPNVTDNIPVSGNQEDHVSMAMTTAVRSHAVLELVEELVVFELMMAVRGLNLVDHVRSSDALERVLELINQRIEFQPQDHIIHDTLQQFKLLVTSGQITEAIDPMVDLPDRFNALE